MWELRGWSLREMATLEIVKDGHPALKKTAKRIRKMTDELRALASDMIETMQAACGVGLAANQVAKPVRMIAVMHSPEDVRIYVNPKISKPSVELEYIDEGCLSFPLLYGKVGRSLQVTVCARDIDMNNLKFDAEGFIARIFQHEIDHLNGITFTMRAEEGTLHIVEPEPDEPDENEQPEEQPGDQEMAQAGGGDAAAEPDSAD
jgi:peptide deformylase